MFERGSLHSAFIASPSLVLEEAIISTLDMAANSVKKIRETVNSSTVPVQYLYCFT